MVFMCVHMNFFYTNGIVLYETDVLPDALMRHLWYHSICVILQVVFSLNYLFWGFFHVDSCKRNLLLLTPEYHSSE